MGQGQDGYVSNLFLVPKQGGGQRPVIILKHLNQFVKYEHFKMENIHMLRDLLKKDDYLVKIDLKDAYFTVAIWVNHQKFLRFTSLEGDSLRVSMPSIRSCFSPARFHEDNETGSRTIAPVGDTHCNLSRRHSDYGPDSRQTPNVMPEQL